MSGSALVTGAGGFVGRHLAKYLEEKGWDVYRCDLVQREGIEKCDITDERDLRRLVDISERFTHIFHLSAMTFVPESVQNPAECFKVNTLATIRFIELLRQQTKVPKFIYISTSEVYGAPKYLPIDEIHPLHPRNPYSISKMASDLFCEFAYKQFSFPVIVVRPFNHSGPGQNERFVLSNFAKQFAEMNLKRKEKVLLVGNLNIERDFLHISDVVKAYELIAVKGNIGEVYNLCSGKPVKLSYVVDVLKKISGIEPEIVIEPSRVRQTDVSCVYGSYSKLSSHLDWHPIMSLEDILKDLYEFWITKLCNEIN